MDDSHPKHPGPGPDEWVGDEGLDRLKPAQENLFDLGDGSAADAAREGTGPKTRRIPVSGRQDRVEKGPGPSPLRASVDARDDVESTPSEMPGDESAGFVGEGEEIAPLAEALADRLRSQLASEQYKTWFHRSKLVRVDDHAATIAVPNSFARDWVIRYYGEELEKAVAAVLGQPRKVRVIEQPESLLSSAVPPAVASPPPSSDAPPAAPQEESPARSSEAPSFDAPAQHQGADPRRSSSEDRMASEGGIAPESRGALEARRRQTQIPARRGQLESSSDFALNQKCTFDSFVVGPCNRFGHAASMGAAEQPGKSYNPLFLYGRVGVGKTHLLQAFCFSVLERFPDYRILYLSCETFVNHFINALDSGDMQRFRDKYRDIDVLVIDDIQILANKEKSQEEFFHTFNSLYNAGKQIVLSSDSPPKDIPTLHDRLVSRFKWGMVTEVEPPCYETRMAIVKRKSRERNATIPDDVAQFIAENIEENVRELEGAVTRLLGYSRMTGADMTLELAREALAGLIEVRKGAPTVNDIIEIVTEHYQVKLSDLQSKRRTKVIAYPRQVAMYLARKVTRHSLEEIGGFFGGRDHTTVLYAVDKVEKLIVKDADVAKVIQTFMEKLGHSRRASS